MASTRISVFPSLSIQHVFQSAWQHTCLISALGDRGRQIEVSSRSTGAILKQTNKPLITQTNKQKKPCHHVFLYFFLKVLMGLCFRFKFEIHFLSHTLTIVWGCGWWSFVVVVVILVLVVIVLLLQHHEGRGQELRRGREVLSPFHVCVKFVKNQSSACSCGSSALLHWSARLFLSTNVTPAWLL